MKELFLGAIRTSRKTLLVVLAELDEKTLTTVPVTGPWTGKDLLGHVAACDRAIVDAFPAVRRGEAPVWVWDQYSDFDAWNVAESEKWRDRPFQTVVAELATVREALLAELERWPAEAGPFGPDTWDEHASPIGWLPSHEAEHAAELSALQTKRS